MKICLLRHGWDITDYVIMAMLWTSGGDLFWPKVKNGSRNRQMSLVIKLLFSNFSLITGELIK